MKKLLLFGLPIALVVSVPAIAQNAFDGTWKFNLNDAQFPKKTFFCCKTGCIIARLACPRLM